MAAGDLSSVVAASERSDEIGSIARAVDNFRHSLFQVRDIQSRERENDLQRGACGAHPARLGPL
jgi:hypothetical protein